MAVGNSGAEKSTQQKLPYSLSAEQSFLGALLFDPDALTQALDLVHEDDFYRENHRVIFQTMEEMFDKNEKMDITTLEEKLMRTQRLTAAGGTAYLSELASNSAGSILIKDYAKIIRDKAINRKIILGTHQISKTGFQGTASLSEMITELEDLTKDVQNQRSDKAFYSVGELLPGCLEELQKIKDRPEGAVTGVPSGYKDLDDITSGFQNSDLIILAARPGVGKTSFALNLALHAAYEKSIPVAIFSLEMGREQLMYRFLSMISKIPMEKLRNGSFTSGDLDKIGYATYNLQDAPIYISDISQQSISEIKARANRLNEELLQKQKKLGLILVDYLQLARSSRPKENRATEVAEISSGLKGLAKDLNIPCIALSQLNRSIEQRTDKRPQLSDLRESGAIEQDADIVMFLHREEIYDPETDKQGQVEILVRKHRNGRTGEVTLVFFSKLMRFENFASHANQDEAL